MKGNEIILKNDRRNLDAITTYQKKRKRNGRYLIYFLMVQRL